MESAESEKPGTTAPTVGYWVAVVTSETNTELRLFIYGSVGVTNIVAIRYMLSVNLYLRILELNKLDVYHQVLPKSTTDRVKNVICRSFCSR